MITAPHPMTVTFVRDSPDGDVRLLDAWWPARLLIDGALISLAKEGHVQGLTFDQHDDGTFVSPLVARFAAANGAAVYREVTPRDHILWQRDVYEFDCVSCSRDVSDATP